MDKGPLSGQHTATTTAVYKGVHHQTPDVLKTANKHWFSLLITSLIGLIQTAVGEWIVGETRDNAFKTATKCRQQERRQEARPSLPI